MIMEITAFGQSHVGQKRKHNEDAFLVDKELDLFIVCDGMGGAKAGAVASNACIKHVRASLERNRTLLDAYRSEQDVERREQIIGLIKGAITKASTEILTQGEHDASKKGMGTTIALVLVAGTSVFLAHVGDTRIYLLRDGAIHQLSEDHTAVMDLVRAGKMSREKAASSPLSRILTQAVGRRDYVVVDTLHMEVMPRDTYLVCSNGVSDVIPTSGIVRALVENETYDAPRKLIDAANRYGGADNITAIVIRTGDAKMADEHISASEKLELLSKVPLFANMTYKELISILDISAEKSFPPGEMVAREDTIEDEIHVILSGKVRLETRRERILDLGAGQHFGEMCLVNAEPRSIGAVALEQSKVLAIKRETLYSTLKSEPQVAIKLLWTFAQDLHQRLRVSNEQLLAAHGGPNMPAATRAGLLQRLLIESRSDLAEHGVSGRSSRPPPG